MGEMTLRQALDEFRTIYLASRNFALRSREEYVNDIEDLISFLERSGFNRIGELGIPQIDRYLAELDRRGLAGSTRKRKTITIRSFFAFLYREKMITHDISQKIIIPFAESTPPRVLTQAEYQRLVAACAKSIRDTAIIELLLQTGIRLSELTRLRTSDIETPSQEAQGNGLSGLITIIGGGGRKSRSIPLNSKARRALQAYLQTRSSISTDTFFVNKAGHSLGERGVQKMVKKYLDIAGIKRASVESLRHTFGAHHAAKGTDLKTIQEIMGHQDSRTTEIYISLARQIKRQELEENGL